MKGKSIINGHEFVDLGLDVKWATCNIGAERPEDTGDFFAWGELEKKDLYVFDNYAHGYHDERNYRCFKPLGKDLSGSEYDVAHVKWGESWRMPTLDDIADLIYDCEWEWVENDQRVGYCVTGPNGNSIFLPAAGCYEDSSRNFRRDIGGYYWSSCEVEDAHSLTYTFCLVFTEEYVDGENTYRRHCGYSIRPVTDVK